MAIKKEDEQKIKDEIKKDLIGNDDKSVDKSEDKSEDKKQEDDKSEKDDQSELKDKSQDLSKRAEKIIQNQYQKLLNDAPEMLQKKFANREDNLISRLDDLEDNLNYYNKIKDEVKKEYEEKLNDKEKQKQEFLESKGFSFDFGEGLKILPDSHKSPQPDNTKIKGEEFEERELTWNGRIKKSDKSK
jgi:hypothetical protein